MEAVPTKALQSVDAHTAQYVLNLEAPAAKKVGQPSGSDVGIDPLGQPEIRSTDAPGTFASMALLTYSASQGDKSGSSDVDGIGT
jgi:hypothetical protein